MRTTISIDDELIAIAKEYTGIEDAETAVGEALKTFVTLEAGRRLAAMGGSDPDAAAAPRKP